ncbi:MAG: hypothetical protein JXA13_14845 [Anaerolineales bacterium]|nr:hypothetical protein [Anaerolineales bacterium]
MTKKLPRLGNLPPKYNFFLNPYLDARFTRCPKCEGKNGQKKVPLAIHVDPHYPIILNYTCRYCSKCDLLIAHQNEIEGHLSWIFSKRVPEVVGNDYLVMGTTGRKYWKEGVDNPHDAHGIMDHLHGFKQYLNFELVGGWQPEKAIPAQAKETGISENHEILLDADNLVARMQAALPISVRAGKDLLKLLRKRGIPISKLQTFPINSVFYGGDEMGIACGITPPGKYKEAIVCSLTHLEVMGKSRLAEAMRTYQIERERKLAEQGAFGMMDIAFNPKRK